VGGVGGGGGGLKTEGDGGWGQDTNCSLCRSNKSTTHMLLKLPRQKDGGRNIKARSGNQ